MLIAFRLVWRIGRVVLLLALVYFVVTGVTVWRSSRRDEARRADAIVVFGAAQYNGRPSRVLTARLDHAVDLYRRGFADSVVVTGGKQAGDRFTEASASAAYLAKRKVPEPAILREVSGKNSWQSLAATAGFLKNRGITRVLLVSDPFHSARVTAMADELGLEAYTSPTRTSPIRGAAEIPYLAKETVAVGLGRVIGFRRLMRVDKVVTRVRTKAANR